jgi:hypothetical protein
MELCLKLGVIGRQAPAIAEPIGEVAPELLTHPLILQRPSLRRERRPHPKSLPRLPRLRCPQLIPDDFAFGEERSANGPLRVYDNSW